MLLAAANGGAHQPYAPAKVRRDPKLGVSPILVIPLVVICACCLGKRIKVGNIRERGEVVGQKS